MLRRSSNLTIAGICGCDVGFRKPTLKIIFGIFCRVASVSVWMFVCLCNALVAAQYEVMTQNLAGFN